MAITFKLLCIFYWIHVSFANDINLASLDEYIEVNVIDDTWYDTWNWMIGENIVVQASLCAAICCCLTCTVIFCKKCCCQNTCNPSPEGQRKRIERIIRIKDPPINEQEKRRLSVEGKKSSKLRKGDQRKVSYHSCGSSTLNDEGGSKLWESIKSIIPGINNNNINNKNVRYIYNPKLDSYDLFANDYEEHIINDDDDIKSEEEEDNIVEYETCESEDDENDDNNDDNTDTESLLVSMTMSQSSIMPHQAYKFSNLDFDMMTEFLQHFGPTEGTRK